MYQLESESLKYISMHGEEQDTLEGSGSFLVVHQLRELWEVQFSVLE